MRVQKLSLVDWIWTVIQSSEDILVLVLSSDDVNGFLSFQLSQDSTTQSTGTCEDWVTCFLESLHHL